MFDRVSHVDVTMAPFEPIAKRARIAVGDSPRANAANFGSRGNDPLIEGGNGDKRFDGRALGIGA